MPKYKHVGWGMEYRNGKRRILLPKPIPNHNELFTATYRCRLKEIWDSEKYKYVESINRNSVPVKLYVEVEDG